VPHRRRPAARDVPDPPGRGLMIEQARPAGRSRRHVGPKTLGRSRVTVLNSAPTTSHEPAGEGPQAHAFNLAVVGNKGSDLACLPPIVTVPSTRLPPTLIPVGSPDSDVFGDVPAECPRADLRLVAGCALGSTNLPAAALRRRVRQRCCVCEARYTANQAVDLTERLSLFSEHWSPKVVARLNDYEIKVVKIKGEFVWHTHQDTDELFHRRCRRADHPVARRRREASPRPAVRRTARRRALPDRGRRGPRASDRAKRSRQHRRCRWCPDRYLRRLARVAPLVCSDRRWQPPPGPRSRGRANTGAAWLRHICR
jgi:hypothetical protein